MINSFRALLALLAVAGPMFGMAAARADILPPKPRPDACTEQYQPVCGELSGARKTYSNACFAKQAGATVIAAGACTKEDTSPSH